MTVLNRLLTIVMFIASVSSQAESLSNFNYDVFKTSVGITSKRLAVGGSKAVHPNAFISGELVSQINDDYQVSVGANFNAPVTDWADIYGGVFASHHHYSNARDNNIWTFNVGYRQWLSPQLEAFGTISWDYLEETEMALESGVYFHATQVFSLGMATFLHSRQNEVLILNARYDF